MRIVAAAALALACTACWLEEDGSDPYCDDSPRWVFYTNTTGVAGPTWHGVEVEEHEGGGVSWTARSKDGLVLAFEIADDGSFAEQELFLVSAEGRGSYGFASGSCERGTTESREDGEMPRYWCDLSGTFDGEALRVALYLEYVQPICPVID